MSDKCIETHKGHNYKAEQLGFTEKHEDGGQKRTFENRVLLYCTKCGDTKQIEKE